MSEQERFTDLVRRLRTGDAGAAEELVRHYEPVVRLEVHCRLSDPRLRRAFDTLDICQAVLASFFVRAAAGQFDLERPEQLVHLLKEMARRKLAHFARQERAEKRDVRRVEPAEKEGWDGAAAGPTPSVTVAERDLLEAVRGRLSDEERLLADLRARGLDWPQIVAEVGGTPSGRRKQLARALDRVSRELGLEADDG
jgi:RNA polymerase sigma-70 factor (ECF subfamily)